MQPGGSEVPPATPPSNNKKATEDKREQREAEKEKRREARARNRMRRKKYREEDLNYIYDFFVQCHLFFRGIASPFFRGLGMLLLFLLALILIPGYTWCLIAYLKGNSIAEGIFVGIQVLSSFASIGIGFWGISLAKESARDFTAFKQSLKNINYAQPAVDPTGEVKNDEK